MRCGVWSWPAHMRVIADGDYVALHMLISFGGHTMVVLGLTRLENGRFVEHWDVIQPASQFKRPGRVENLFIFAPVYPFQIRTS